MLEKDIQLLILCLKEYIKDIDGEEFKKIFLGYVEYMARNYGQDCTIDEYDLMMNAAYKFVNMHKLDLKTLTPYKRDILCRWIKLNYDAQDILSLYYFKDEISALECFIDLISSKYQ